MDAIKNILAEVVLAFENNHYAQVTPCNLSKVFHCVDRIIQVSKLKHLVSLGVCFLLKPLLILVMVNYCVLIFYPDTVLVNVNSDYNPLTGMAYEALQFAVTWFKANNLVVNDLKTQKGIYSLDHNMAYRNEIKYLKPLQISVHHNLIWENHTEHACTKIPKVVCLLKTLTLTYLILP